MCNLMNIQHYMNIGNNEYHRMTNEHDCGIDYDKYLQCPKCKESRLYCNLHKLEVDKILNSTKSKNNSHQW